MTPAVKRRQRYDSVMAVDERVNKMVKMVCYHCNKRGHIEKDCWKNFPDKMPKSDQYKVLDLARCQGDNMVAQVVYDSDM